MNVVNNTTFSSRLYVQNSSYVRIYESLQSSSGCVSLSDRYRVVLSNEPTASSRASSLRPDLKGPSEEVYL